MRFQLCHVFFRWKERGRSISLSLSPWIILKWEEPLSMRPSRPRTRWQLLSCFTFYFLSLFSPLYVQPSLWLLQTSSCYLFVQKVSLSLFSFTLALFPLTSFMLMNVVMKYTWFESLFSKLKQNIILVAASMTQMWHFIIIIPFRALRIVSLIKPDCCFLWRGFCSIPLSSITLNTKGHVLKE